MFEDMLKELEKMRKEMDEMNKRFTNQINSAIGNINSVIKAPKIEFKDKGNKVTLKIELPKVRKEDIELYLNETSMEVSAKVKKMEETIGKGVYQVKKVMGEFKKLMPLPVEIKPETIKTKFENGVLEITAEKKNPAAPKKKIAVKPKKKIKIKVK